MKNILLFLAFILVSCGVVSINKTTNSKTTSVLELGAIGKFDNSLIDKQFHIHALPEIQKKVRIAPILKKFDKSSSKAYNKFQEENKKISINDSLSLNPSYFLFTIINKVTLLQELNSLNNNDIISFLKTSNESSIITSIAIRFPTEIHEKIINAEEFFIVNSKNQKLVLQLFKDDVLSDVISFSKGLVFDYESSNFCWSENDQHQIIITDISNNSCSKNNYKSYSKALKKKKEFKY